jgi:acetoin utilization deacetylase AcuC-like enzyme
MDAETEIERFHERLDEAERLGWRDPESIKAALEAAGTAIEALKEIIEDQHETIALLTGPAALQ